MSVLPTTFPDESFRGVLILADISGYTHFSRLHYTSLLHAEQIITELMESIVQSAEFPLQVGQLEGDAVLLFVEAPAGREATAVSEAARQVQAFFKAFNLRERSLIACDAGCACQACNQIGELRLKAVLHFGTFTRREFHGAVELVGDDITLIHNLLKAPIEEREHILLTEPFHQLSGGLPGQAIHESRLLPAGDQNVTVHIYLPRIDLSMAVVPKGAGPAFSGRLNQYSFGRMLLRKPRAAFRNLPQGGMNLLLYLLEGLNSPISIIRKHILRGLHRGPTDVIVRPGMLMMVEVQAVNETGRSLAPELLEAAVSAARPPLVFNKVEGDAMLLYALAENDRAILASGLVNQAKRMFSAFMFKRGQALAADPDKGQELKAIRFRVICHSGDVAFKRIREFDELAGLGVILTHRLLQRAGATGSSLWMTEPFHALVMDGKTANAASTVISLEDLGDIPVKVLAL